MQVALTKAAMVVTATVTFTAPEVNQPWKVDWGDGTVETKASGTASGNHTYAKSDTYKVTVSANDNANTQPITVGQTPFKAYDPLKVLENSVAGSQANERAKAARTMGARTHVG